MRTPTTAGDPTIRRPRARDPVQSLTPAPPHKTSPDRGGRLAILLTPRPTAHHQGAHRKDKGPRPPSTPKPCRKSTTAHPSLYFIARKVAIVHFHPSSTGTFPPHTPIFTPASQVTTLVPSPITPVAAQTNGIRAPYEESPPYSPNPAKTKISHFRFLLPVRPPVPFLPHRSRSVASPMHESLKSFPYSHFLPRPLQVPRMITSL